jgi:hypothetical protein
MIFYRCKPPSTRSLGRIVLVVNGRSAMLASLFVDAVHQLVPGFVVGHPLGRNEGLSYSWNTIIRTAFVLPIPRELIASGDGGEAAPSVQQMRTRSDFVWISNVDLVHQPGAIAACAEGSRKKIVERNMLISNVTHATDRDHLPAGLPQPLRLLRIIGFAAFIYCSSALPVYGYFDKTLFPAYGEDIEFQMRIKANGDLAGISPPIHAEHVGSVVYFRDNTVRAMINRFPRWEYLTAKWNVTHTEDLWTSPHLFKHPFDDPRLQISAWAVDPKQRACVRHGAQEGRACAYDRDLAFRNVKH